MVTVVKCGSGGVSVELVCADVAALRAQGRAVVLVHGGADDIDLLAGRLGVEQRRLVGPSGVSSRYTDAATLEVLTLALAGRAKPRLLTLLARRGVTAIGLTGLDARLLRAVRKPAVRAVIDGRTVVVRDDHSGRITRVNVGLLHMLLAAGLVPVVSPPAITEEGHLVNVDADRVAAAIAGAVGADHLVLLTDAPGVLADPSDERTLLPRLALKRDGRPGVFAFSGIAAHGGMGLKLVAGHEALAAGVRMVTVADGRRPRSIQAALEGGGTVVELDPRSPRCAR
ncbi:MAG: [LysW]-aminoadipate kinase [Egibacteraceae bacterium]